MSSVVLSWSIFLALVGGIYWVYFSPKSAAVRSSSKAVAEDKGAGSIFLGASGTESAVAGEKKKKKKKAALSNTAAKEPVSTGNIAKAAESTDDDVAQEVDQAELLRRLQSLKEGGNVGGKKSSSASSSTRLAPKKALAAPASPFATASQTSSAGADADIDEEEATRLPESEYSSVSKQSHSSDPSDMLDPSTGGPGVLKITSSTQLPRSQKQKTTSAADQAGVHASKNAKKKEKQKAAKEAEKAEQKARFELHRATMRAAESAKQKNKPQAATPPPPSAWTSVNSQTALTAPTPPKTDGLLDTFSTPSTINKPGTSDDSPIDSEDEKKQMRSTHLDNSYWEEIPEHLIGGWNEVQKKSRKQKKAATDAQAGDESTDAKSGTENFQSKSSVKAPVKAPTKIVRQTIQKKDTSTSGNGFQLLDSGSTTSDTKNSSSDWAEIDDSDNWAVHPEE
ncbi:hypothetical protein DFP73DRAFT_29971 [Morchella snyderi]|nr:hypothetical protein DFP73DRAFT_29971 [Morchella snyderi]